MAAEGATARFNDVRWVEEIDSTNRALVDEARSGATGPSVLVADHQTAGRGRQGRTWLAPPGAGLLVSVLVTPAVHRSVLPLLTVAAATATVEAITELTGLEPQLKWPNDVMVGDRKLAGVLAEGVGPSVVVGVGVNVDWPAELPPEIADVAVALNHLGHEVDRAALLATYLGRLDRWLSVLESGDHLALVAELRRRCVTVGRHVRAETAGGAVEGDAIDVNDRGELLVDASDGRVTISAADVIHLRDKRG